MHGSGSGFSQMQGDSLHLLQIFGEHSHINSPQFLHGSSSQMQITSSQSSHCNGSPSQGSRKCLDASTKSNMVK